MAYTVSSFFETIVAPAALNNTLVPRYRNAFLDSVFNGYQAGQNGHVGMPTVINIPVVNEADVTDIGNGSLAISNKDNRPVTITIDKKFSVSKKIESFDAIRTPVQLKEQFMQGMLESLLRKCNRSIGSLFTPANFNKYPTIAGANAGAFNRLNVSAAWGNVVGTGAAPETGGDLFFFTDQAAFANMVGDKGNDWITEALVGINAAELAQQRAVLAPAFNCRIDYDQTMVAAGGPTHHGGIFYHRMAVGALPLPEAKPSATAVEHMVIYPTRDKRWPVMVQFGYSLEAQGYILHLYSIFGQAVIYPEWGSYLETPASA